jgi:hypothetical protein
MDDLIGRSITYQIAVGARAGQKLVTLQTVPARLLREECNRNGAARAAADSHCTRASQSPRAPPGQARLLWTRSNRPLCWPLPRRAWVGSDRGSGQGPGGAGWEAWADRISGRRGIRAAGVARQGPSNEIIADWCERPSRYRDAS